MILFITGTVVLVFARVESSVVCLFLIHLKKAHGGIAPVGTTEFEIQENEWVVQLRLDQAQTK
jgi:hypothetical protein